MIALDGAKKLSPAEKNPQHLAVLGMNVFLKGLCLLASGFFLRDFAQVGFAAHFHATFFVDA